MSAQIALSFVYPHADFPSGTVNAEVLEQEIKDASGVTSNPTSVTDHASVATITFDALLSAAEATALDAVVAAHEGDAFSPDFQKQEENAQQSTAADNNEVTVCSLASGPLRAGQYNVEWYGEHKLSANTVGGATKVYTYIGKNGAAATVRAADSKPAHWDWSQVFGKLPFTIKDGETLDIQLRLQRQGTLTTETAQCQRMRLFLTRVGD